MRVAGIGCRADVTAEALQEVLQAAGGSAQVLATLHDRAMLPAVMHFAADLGIPLRIMDEGALHQQVTLTQSPRIEARFGTGSVSEAAALAAAGPGARLIGPRVISADGSATAAIAEGPTP